MEMQTDLPTEVKKKGRPPLPPSMIRIPISTTLPRNVIEMIRERRWLANELIQDGIDHREICRDVEEKIMKLQTIIQRQNEEIDELRAKLEQSTKDLERCREVFE